MKKLLSILLILNGALSSAQDFEGVITYKSTYLDSDMDMSITELEEMYGTETKTFIKNGFYMEVSNTNFIGYQLWRHCDTAVYYRHKRTDDTLLMNYTNLRPGGDFTFKLENNADTILGYPCDLLTVKNDRGTIKYYFSSEFSLDPEYYVNYSHSNKYEIVKLMESIYLRLSVSYEYMHVDLIAVDIERRDLPEKIFEVPENMIIKYVDY
jgi:hypothetical protein